MRKSGIVLVVIGVVVLAVAAVWVPVALPVLTKLPTSLNTTVYYSGTYTGYVNQATGAPLAAPQVLPVTVTRQVKAVPAKSTSADLVVSDTSTAAIGPQKQSQVLQYALDRSSEKSVKSSDAYALVPGDVVNRAGTPRRAQATAACARRWRTGGIYPAGRVLRRPASAAQPSPGPFCSGVRNSRWRSMSGRPILTESMPAWHRLGGRTRRQECRE
jgi:hypothetical protein